MYRRTHKPPLMPGCKRAIICRRTNKDLGWTPLHYAAAGAYLKVARRLLKMKKYDVNARTKEGWTPLHIAVIQKVRALVELLLVNGAKLNATDNYGWTPLHLAVVYLKDDNPSLEPFLEGLQSPATDYRLNSNEEAEQDYSVKYPKGWEDAITRLLLKFDRGADLTIRNKDGNTALDLAILARNSFAATIIWERYLSLLPEKEQKQILNIGYAALHYDVTVVRYLVYIGRSSTLYNGWTPLYCACYAEKIDVVRFLLHANKDGSAISRVNAPRRFKHKPGGQTPVHIAAEKNNVEILNILLEGNYIIKRVDCDGCTPLIGAAAAGSTAAVEILLDHGMDPMVQGIVSYNNKQERRTAMGVAAESGHIGIALMLLRHMRDDSTYKTLRDTELDSALSTLEYVLFDPPSFPREDFDGRHRLALALLERDKATLFDRDDPTTTFAPSSLSALLAKAICSHQAYATSFLLTRDIVPSTTPPSSPSTSPSTSLSFLPLTHDLRPVLIPSSQPLSRAKVAGIPYLHHLATTPCHTVLRQALARTPRGLLDSQHGGTTPFLRALHAGAYVNAEAFLDAGAVPFPSGPCVGGEGVFGREGERVAFAKEVAWLAEAPDLMVRVLDMIVEREMNKVGTKDKVSDGNKTLSEKSLAAVSKAPEERMVREKGWLPSTFLLFEMAAEAARERERMDTVKAVGALLKRRVEEMVEKGLVGEEEGRAWERDWGKDGGKNSQKEVEKGSVAGRVVEVGKGEGEKNGRAEGEQEIEKDGEKAVEKESEKEFEKGFGKEDEKEADPHTEKSAQKDAQRDFEDSKGTSKVGEMETGESEKEGVGGGVGNTLE